MRRIKFVEMSNVWWVLYVSMTHRHIDVWLWHIQQTKFHLLISLGSVLQHDSAQLPASQIKLHMRINILLCSFSFTSSAEPSRVLVFELFRSVQADCNELSVHRREQKPHEENRIQWIEYQISSSFVFVLCLFFRSFRFYLIPVCL